MMTQRGIRKHQTNNNRHDVHVRRQIVTSQLMYSCNNHSMTLKLLCGTEKNPNQIGGLSLSAVHQKNVMNKIQQ